MVWISTNYAQKISLDTGTWATLRWCATYIQPLVLMYERPRLSIEHVNWTIIYGYDSYSMWKAWGFEALHRIHNPNVVASS